MSEPSTVELLFSGISSLATAAAAAFAAWSAWTSKASAKAAEGAVQEARKARQADLLPRLILERNFLDFHFVWPHPSTLNGEAVFLARRHWQDNDPQPPTFSLSNYGSGPALEVEIVFELDDPNGEFSAPATFAPLGLSVHQVPMLPASNAMPIYALQYGMTGCSLPLYRKWTNDIPHCAPGQTREIEFPQHLLNLLFLRGLQYWERRGQSDSLDEIILTVQISCHTVEGEPYNTQFRFKAFPFWQGQSDPLIVHGHFSELPMYPKSGQRVA